MILLENYFYKYYIPVVEIKIFNALIGNKPFFNKPVKNKKKLMKNLLKIQIWWLYKRNLSDYLYHQNYHKRIGIDLSRQTNTNIPQQINFVGKLEGDDGATTFFVSEKQQKTILDFSLDSLIVTE